MLNTVLRAVMKNRNNVYKSQVQGLSQLSGWVAQSVGWLIGWVAQSVEHPTLNFSSGHGPRVMGLSSTSASSLSMEPAWDSLSLSLCPSPLLACACSLYEMK